MYKLHHLKIYSIKKESEKLHLIEEWAIEVMEKNVSSLQRIFYE